MNYVWYLLRVYFSFFILFTFSPNSQLNLSFSLPSFLRLSQVPSTNLLHSSNVINPTLAAHVADLVRQVTGLIFQQFHDLWFDAQRFADLLEHLVLPLVNVSRCLTNLWSCIQNFMAHCRSNWLPKFHFLIIHYHYQYD